MHDTKKGKYTDEENDQIITAINQGLKNGLKEREILKELSIELNRGYTGIMSHVRKLRSEYPDRFDDSDNYKKGNQRLNSWEKEEEDIVIETVNSFLEKGKSLSSAISELERRLSRTQGAIYQRIYTLRRKHPERFNHLPAQRPRKRKQITDWQTQRPTIRPINEYSASSDIKPLATHQNSLSQDQTTSIDFSDEEPLSDEEKMVYQAFEDRYGRPHQNLKKKLIQLMRTYGCTRVSIALLTITDDKEFPNFIIHFLEKRLLVR